MTTRSGDLAITAEGWAASTAKQREERDANPQFAAMAKAAAITKDEQAAIEACEQRLQEAEAELNAAGVALDRAQRGMEPIRTPDPRRPRTFFQRTPETYRAAAASLPGLRADVGEARGKRQNAQRRLNATVADVNRARDARRRAAKIKHTPKAPPVRSRSDGWGSIAAMNRWSNTEEAN